VELVGVAGVGGDVNAVGLGRAAPGDLDVADVVARQQRQHMLEVRDIAFIA